MKLLIFTEGTILMPRLMRDLTREQRVRRSKLKIPWVYNFKNHIPVGNAVDKIRNWNKQGAEIFYLTSRRKKDQINDIKSVLEKYNFPDNKNLLFREKDEDYKNVAERLVPDIIIEDDCESIGGVKEMAYTHIEPELKNRIKLVAIKEFGGIDHLFDNLADLIADK